MNFYSIDALAPLVFRSGKPFGAQSDSDDIMFPLPSAAAGLIRTLSAQQQADFAGQYDVELLKQIAVNGLFLAQFDDSGSIKLFVPKPSDAIYLKNKETGETELHRLAPKKFADNVGADFPNDSLLPVQLLHDIKGKPQSGAMFWAWQDFVKWQNNELLTFDNIKDNGAASLSIEVRTHVAIDRHSLASQDGKLFQTAAYDFANAKHDHHQGWEQHRYGFVIATEQSLNDDAVCFGGEGRLSRFQVAKLSATPYQTPDHLVSNIQKTGKIKLTLLSPAIFKQGWLPEWLDKDTLTGKLPNSNIRVTLRACAIDRWQAVSGWDLAIHKPKSMRKAVAAGTVYWFDVENTNDIPTDFSATLSICDNEQDNKDGFGIAHIAAWQQID